MPKLKPSTQAARRDRILDAARRCIARHGFHRTTMNEICAEAGISLGALYVYFDSKEALISGLCERDRAEFAERFANLATAPDFISALRSIAEQYFVDEPSEKRLFVVEMGVESTRNPRVSEIYCSVDRFCQDNFATLFQRLKDEGRIAPKLTVPELTAIFNLIGEGLFWRRAVHPDFDASKVLPALSEVFEFLLAPRSDNSANETPEANQNLRMIRS